MPIFRQLRATLRCAALGVCSCFASSAAAQEPVAAPASAPAEPALRMIWESDDPACSGDDVSARALQMVTPGVAVRPLRATVQVQRDDDHWLVRMQTESGDQSGQRSLRAESCKELQEAIALLLAMAMESKSDILPPEPPAPAPEPAPPAEPVPAPVAAPPAPTESRDERPAAGSVATSIPLGWFARLDGKAAGGLKPGLGVGAGVSAGVRLGSFDVGVGAAYWPESRKPAPERAGFVDIARRSLALHLCWNAWRAGPLVLAPCLSPGAVVFVYQSTALRRTVETQSKPLPTVTAGFDLRYELVGESFSFLLRPALTWERRQPFRMALTDEPLPADGPPPATVFEEIYKTSGFGPGVEIGVDARF
jgi:hypothetical protein